MNTGATGPTGPQICIEITGVDLTGFDNINTGILHPFLTLTETISGSGAIIMNGIVTDGADKTLLNVTVDFTGTGKTTVSSSKIQAVFSGTAGKPCHKVGVFTPSGSGGVVVFTFPSIAPGPMGQADYPLTHGQIHLKYS